MERKPRLGSIERVGELAHATLASAEELDDLEPGLVGERVEELYRAVGSRMSRYCHEIYYINESCYVNGELQLTTTCRGLWAGRLTAAG